MSSKKGAIQPIKVSSLDSYAIIESRLSEEAADKTNYISPFKSDEVKSIFRKMSNGNLREALIIAQHCYLEASNHTSSPHHVYLPDDLLRCLYGTPSVSKDNEDSTEEPRHLINILTSLDTGDPVPFLYIALSCLQSPCIIDDVFVKKFNEEISFINPKVSSDYTINTGKVLQILWECHKKGLLRRLDHVNLQDITKSQDQYKPSQALFGHKLGLTEKGAFLLSLCCDELYQELTALETWRTGVHDKIKDRKFNLIVPEQRFIFADAKSK